MRKVYFVSKCNTAELEEIDVSISTLGNMPSVPELENQKDLTKLVAILLSTGINRNHDVFIPEEVLPVRNTGAHKPVNLEHDPEKIIGHMLRTFATEKDGKIVKDKNKPKGKAFDITAEAVLYSFLFPELTKEIKNRARDNELFVSVEVWFTEYDYLFGNKIIKRNEKTAGQFEPYLKSNGGAGFLDDKKVGRVLRNLIIGGIGVVKNPANPESIIKSVSNLDFQVVNEIGSKTSSESETDHKEGYMEVLLMDHTVIEEMAALASARNAVEQSNKERAPELSISSESPELQSLSNRIAQLERSNKELKVRADEADFKAELSRRVSMLAQAGVSEEISERHIVRCFNMNKADFDEYVSLLIDTLNTVAKAQASVSAETEVDSELETAEGGDEINDESQEEAPEAQDKASEPDPVLTEVETEVVDQVNDTQEDSEEDIEIDIEAVDVDINTEGDGSKESNSLEDIMGDIVQKFLSKQNPRWEKLALNK